MRYVRDYLASLAGALWRNAGRDSNNNGGEAGSHRAQAEAGTWIVDTGSKCHATADLGLFSGHLDMAKPGNWVHGATGHDLPIVAAGPVQFAHFTLQDVQYVPGLAANLISVPLLRANGYGVTFRNAGSCIFDDATGKHICDIRYVEGFFELDSLPAPYYS